MPNYDYKCKNCSFEFEEFQKMSDAPLQTCPQCKTDSLVRLIHGGAGLHFKGSGFYLTDYKKSHSSSASETKSEKDSSAKKEEKKTETKAETKSSGSGTTQKE